jgi:hypothetical protein
MKPRHHLYLDDDLTAQLEALSGQSLTFSIPFQFR